MLRATFAGFSVARGALTASQKALDVTGQNISNVYTAGYTRQRLDQVSMSMGYGNYSYSNYTAQVGNGVLITGISQIRDPYLDIQYRNQMANVGASDAKNSILEQVEGVFDETMKSSIKDAFSDLESKLLDLANSTGSELDDSIVRASMQSLVNIFHANATNLADKRDQITDDFENNSIRQVNALLKDIAELNKSIKNSQVLGYPALELQDDRNNKLDELASYIPIEIIRTDEKLSSTEKVENVQVNILLNKNQKFERFTLIDNDKYGSFESETADKFTEVTLNHLQYNGNTVVTNPDGTPATAETAITEKTGDTVNIFIEGGTFKGTLDMLNSSGVFDGDAATEKGLGYYEQAFDLLVDKFATVMNELNQKANDANGQPTGDGGNLFTTNTGATSGFTAANIKINEDWIRGIVKLKAKQDPTSGSTQNDNINKFIDNLNKDQKFEVPIPGATNTTSTIYTGNFYNYYVNTIESTLGIEQQSTKNLLDNHVTVINTIAQSKDQVSGVSLDEEGVNLMQYQQSFTAASRLMTSLDEILDKLINGTGVCGR
ncbi:MAG: flagellar hook-associated protein FlgK [Lachnospiraceae bacterium]|nr:flagellar hook-associated protein FlgK [Lachnospiraceae bacterium]